MGHKKRIVAPRSKPSISPTPAVPPVSDEGSPPSLDSDQQPLVSTSRNDALVESDFENNGNSGSVKLECQRALTALRRGNHTKALRLMKDLSAKHEKSSHSALIHRVQGTICAKVASIIDDPNAKQRHLRNAIESARRAVSLSPNSIEFAHFYANLLYEAASDGKEYEEVVQECEKALAIENPIDPAKESLQEESQLDTSPEKRITNVNAELQSLIQRANFASISTWMKDVGPGAEKFRLIPIRRASEDPIELRLVQARRPNEIKKATKTPEERRKEIEVRVAAARLLQQKSQSSKSQNDGDKGLDSTAGQRAGERRRSGNARRNASSSEGKRWVQSYWNSMSLDVMKDLLKIRILDFKAHFNASKDRLAFDVLSKALPFAKTNKSWKFWACCRCSEKFAKCESHNHHVVHDHMGSLPPKMLSVLPQSVENEWAEMLLHCSWKPLEFDAAVKMINKQSRSQGHGFIDDSNGRNDVEGSKNGFLEAFCHEEEWDSSPRNKKSEDRPNGNTDENIKNDKIADVEFMDCDEDGGQKVFFLPEGLPLADDPERAKLLERIHALFEALIKNKCLSSNHLGKVMHFVVEELQGFAFGSQLLNYTIDQSPLFICFLGPEELKKILKYLQELCYSCGLGRYPDRTGTGTVDGTSNVCLGIENLEKIVFSEDGTCLLFDQHFLQHNLSSRSYPDAVGDKSVAILSGDRYQNGVLIDPDALLSWLFTGPSSGDALVSWKCEREEKAQQGTEIFQFLEKEYYDLQGLCESKCEHQSYEEALQAVEDLCLEEGKKREKEIELVRQSYDSVLRKRREVLIDSENEVTVISNRFELDAISNVLKEAESLNINRYGFDETYGGGTSQFTDLESGEEDDWRLKDYLHQVDSCVEVAVQRQKEHVSNELSKIDARIMRMVARMQQLEVKLELASAHDYRKILVPLLKSFMRAHLDDLAEKDATEKSDAARDAILAELARDSEKSTIGANEKSKHTHEKTKDKKKNKEYRKAKDSKPNGGNELHLPHHEVEDATFALARVGGDQEKEIAQTVNSLNIREEDEDYRRMIELEAEEKKLEETLEYQRRIENEAKLKHLAEQQKRTVRTIQDNIGEVMDPESYPYLELSSDANLKYSDIDKKINEQLKGSEKNNEHPNSLEGLSRNTPERMTQRDGLPNKGTPDDETLISDKRSGRKGRRQKGSTKFSEGKFQSVTSERVNTEVSESRALDPSHENNGTKDGGTKTLRQLHVEEDDEERFQADLKRAVRQSLDALHAHQKFPLMPSSGPQRMFSKYGDLGTEINFGNVKNADLYGTGLKNEVGEYNCFLNVIIQSLWHLRQFRDEFLRRSSSEHAHVGDPCVVCALYGIFTALSMVSTEIRREAIAPTSLRIALSNLYPDSNFFLEGQMNDASEVLGVIFDCLHRSFTSTLGVSDTESVGSSCMGSWDCSSSACIVHSLFGMDIFERMNCYSCGLESRHLKYTTFFHNINASALRTMKVMSPESSFDELLNLVEMNHQLACDPEVGGCGNLNYIHHILSASPHVFTMVLGWQNTCESVDDIKATLSALSTELDIAVLYRGLDPKNKHCLVSVVCYYGQHYHCFAYSHDQRRWIMYDDQTVKVIGGWDDVLVMCERGHLQPQVLFFEAVN